MSKQNEKLILKKYLSFNDTDMNYWDEALDAFDYNDLRKSEKESNKKNKTESAVANMSK